jgi:Ca2+-transporting ATPase
MALAASMHPIAMSSVPKQQSRQESDQGVTPLHAQVAGRARFKVDGLYRRPVLKQAIELDLSARPGIGGVEASPLTGNVLVVFDPQLSLAEVAAALRQVARDACAELGVEPEALQAERPAKPAVPRRALRRARPRAPATTCPAPPAVAWHLADASEVLGALATSATGGLASAVAGERLRIFGPNAFPEPPRRSDLEILGGQFKSLPLALLAVSAAVSAATGGLGEAVAIAAVIALNVGIGFFTERQSERTIESLLKADRQPALVLRGGIVAAVAAEQVVPGDILVLAPGRAVPADARLIEAKALTVDESALTGESMPVRKSPVALDRADVALADRTNMIYMGTIVTGGSALAVVVATGPGSELGRVQQLIGEVRAPQTPMQRQLEYLGNRISWLSAGICGGVFALGLVRGYGVLPMLRSAISLAVAAIPEGLPTSATSTLALGLNRMRRQGVLMRRLDAAETLGAVQVMCMDKTGTLTQNRMAVVALHTGMRRINAHEGYLAGAEGRVDLYANHELLRLVHIAVLCNETEVSRAEDGYVLNGTATESALVRLAILCGVSVRSLRRTNPLVRVEYRAEHRNYMSTWHEGPAGPILAVKGSPAEVLALCRWHLRDGERRELTDGERLAIANENERMAGEALRVLGLAYGDGLEPDPISRRELVWLGLAGLADPLRNGVDELIGLFHQAGIRTVMITGDQSATALAIGKSLRLSGEESLEILDATRLEGIEPQVLAALAQRVHVFSRVSPASKLQIVQALQRAGSVVAMTGDGINDGPALRAADIGVAMGPSGTDIARNVADVVLEHDELQTMIVAVGQGRTIYANIRKSIHFLLATNLSEIGVMTASIAAGAGQPLNTMQLLWINLLTDLAPALALAVEPPEPDVLRRPPRDPAEPIVNARDFAQYAVEAGVLTAGAMAAYGYGLARYGVGPRAGTIAFMTLTLSQLAHAWACRSERHGLFAGEHLPRNPYLEAATAGSAALQLATVVFPPLRRLLRTSPIGPADMVLVLGGVGLAFIGNEALKRALVPGHALSIKAGAPRLKEGAP